MQEAYKGSGASRKQNTLDIPPRPMKVSEARDGADDIETSNVLWKQDTSRKSDSVEPLHTTALETLDARDTRDVPVANETPDLEDQIAAHDAEIEDRGEIAEIAYDRHSTAEPASMKTPLLAAAAAVALLAAGWNYSSLESTRAELTAMTQAKATVDGALAEAQGRLLAAEKAVADVKAALSMTPAAATADPAAPAASDPAAKPASE